MTDGERFGDERVRLGPIQWAVVTKYLVSSGLFVRLEDSGEKAFMDMVSVDDHSVCCQHAQRHAAQIGHEPVAGRDFIATCA